MNIIELIEKEVKEKINEHKLNSKDHYDLSDRTKLEFKDKYKLICEIVIGK